MYYYSGPHSFPFLPAIAIHYSTDKTFFIYVYIYVLKEISKYQDRYGIS